MRDLPMDILHIVGGLYVDLLLQDAIDELRVLLTESSPVNFPAEYIPLGAYIPDPVCAREMVRQLHAVLAYDYVEWAPWGLNLRCADGKWDKNNVRDVAAEDEVHVAMAAVNAYRRAAMVMGRPEIAAIDSACAAAAMAAPARRRKLLNHPSRVISCADADHIELTSSPCSLLRDVMRLAYLG